MPSTGAAPARDTQAAFDFAPKPITDVCARKHGGNENSKTANRRVNPFKESTRNRIIAFVSSSGIHGATLHEICEALGKQPHQVSGRLSECKQLGLLIDSGNRRDGSAVLIRGNHV